MDLIGPLFCQVCNVAIPHESARDNHNQGKRHQLALHAALTEDNDYKSSVFSVGGFECSEKTKTLVKNCDL